MSHRIGSIIICAAAVLSLTACTPVGHAVGDTQDEATSLTHDSIHISDMSIGLVGSNDSAADKLAIDALADADISVFYASLDSTESGQQQDSPSAQDAQTRMSEATAQQAVDDFVTRAVDLVVISGINVTDSNREAWHETLTNAREAGIPVALLNPQSVPKDDLLYAATLTVNDQDANAVAINNAVVSIIRDEPHNKSIVVSTVS